MLNPNSKFKIKNKIEWKENERGIKYTKFIIFNSNSWLVRNKKTTGLVGLRVRVYNTRTSCAKEWGIEIRSNSVMTLS